MTSHIKISHSSVFYLFSLTKLRLFKANYCEENQLFLCEINDNLISFNGVYFIDFKNKRFTKLNLKNNTIPKPINNLKYPIVFSVSTIPKLDVPFTVGSKLLSLNKKSVVLNQIQSPEILQKTIDLSISKNLTTCQTHLNQQIQSCPVLNL